MKREYHRWHSPSLGRDMELLVFGHSGARVLAFPTSQGRFYEWEDRGMVHALADPIGRGWVQLFCVDSIDGESWYARDRWPGDRAWRHQQYDDYLTYEFLPFGRGVNGNPFLVSTGASFGGYHAANFAFGHPGDVGRLLAMSGLMDPSRFLHGHCDANCYYNNPCHFLANETDPGRLAALRRMDIILAVGATDGLLESNRRLSEVLWSRGVGNALRVWDGFAHDWPAWSHMLHCYLGGHD